MEKDTSQTSLDASEVIAQVGNYSQHIIDSLVVIIGGLILIYFLYKLASKLLLPFIKNDHFLKVIFGALYVLILDIAILVVLSRMGFEIANIARISIVLIIISAVIIYLLMPFLPRLPFKLGQMVHINGTLGSVQSITTYHTTIRKFDGTTVFIPNAIIMASQIMNYHDSPNRRIEIEINIKPNSNVEAVRKHFVTLMTEDKRIVDEPSAPMVLVDNVSPEGIKLIAYCWVENAHWLATRSDLWIKIVDIFNEDNGISMALPQQTVHIVKED